MTTRKTIALTRWTFVDKVMSLLFNMLSRLVITFLPRSKHLLISWMQSPSAVILEPKKKKICNFIYVPETCIIWFISSLSHIQLCTCFSFSLSIQQSVDGEHLVRCFMAMCMPSLEKCPLDLWPIFLIGLFVFWYWAAGTACMFGRWIPYRYFHLQIFFSILRIAFFCHSWFPWLCKCF